MHTHTQTKVHIYVDIDRDQRVTVEFETHLVTGAEIKHKAGVPADYELAAVKGHRRIAEADHQIIEIKDGELFIAVPAGHVS